MPSVTILDFSTGEEAGVLHDDGRLETDDENLRALYEETMSGGGPTLADGYQEPDDDATIEGFVHLGPGETGFLTAFVDSLPSPYDVTVRERRQLPAPEIPDGKRTGPSDETDG